MSNTSLLIKSAEEYTKYIATKFPDRDAMYPLSDHDECIEWIANELMLMGYHEEQLKLQPFKTDHDISGTNLILTVEGEDKDHSIVAATHYDGDGIGDNASGTALLLAAAKQNINIKPYYTIHYAFLDCEETGCQGAKHYVAQMTDDEIATTLFMVNLDALLFGDYCNVYGGYTCVKNGDVIDSGAYELACTLAKGIGINVVGPKDLDGYFAKHGTGPKIEPNTIYTNPWTKNNPSPNKIDLVASHIAYSPSTIPYSNHAAFVKVGIPYVYFEATNWFAAGTDPWLAYTGYYETYDTCIGDGGMFMNTKHDTLENLERYFPNRMNEHYQIYGPLLMELIAFREQQNYVLDID